MLAMIKYHLILNLREKTMVFWTLAFPLMLGCFFYFGIGGIDEASRFRVIPVVILQTEEQAGADAQEEGNAGTGPQGGAETEMFKEFADGISGSVIDPVYTTNSKKAEERLEKGEALGVYDLTGDEIRLTVAADGISESILKAMLEGFERQYGILEDIQKDVQEDLQKGIPNEAGNQALEQMRQESIDYVKNVSLGGRTLSSASPYYFALLAMACLYMCFLGELAARRTQANISEIGKRISVSPVHRLKIVTANGISACLAAFVNMALIMLFLTKVVRGIDISARPGYAVLTAAMGCLIGVTFGILIESIGKWGQNIKTAILIGSSIFCAFLAGLMIGSMKDIIEKHVPIVNRLNPAALIADSFYCICVYDDMDRLRMNLGIMGVMSVLFLIGAWLMTRRVRYDSL